MSDVTSSAEHEPTADAAKPMSSRLLRGAIWIAIGALIAAALVCVAWVLLGDQDGIVGRAFLTILLLALFAGVAIGEAHLAERRPDWLALASMITWIIALLVGAVKIWLPREFSETFGWVGARFFFFLLVIGVLQLALVHARLFVSASRRYVTTFTRVIVIVTFAMLAALVAMLVLYLTFPDQIVYGELYWRIVVALAILAAVGTTLIPLLNALFAPRAPRAARKAAHVSPQPWPTYADGRTPLPALPDGSPDHNAYHTGRPTYPAQHSSSFPIAEAAPRPPQSAPAAPTAPAADSTPPAPAGPGGHLGFPAPPAVAPRREQTPADAQAPIAHIPGAVGRDEAAPTPPAPPAASPAHTPASAAPPVPPAPPAPPAPQPPQSQDVQR